MSRSALFAIQGKDAITALRKVVSHLEVELAVVRDELEQAIQDRFNVLCARQSRWYVRLFDKRTTSDLRQAAEAYFDKGSLYYDSPKRRAVAFAEVELRKWKRVLEAAEKFPQSVIEMDSYDMSFLQQFA